jgi:anti-repressor protein
MTPSVNAREVHSFLSVRRAFANWFCDEVARAGFVLGDTYEGVSQSTSASSRGGRPRKDYVLKLYAAVEIVRTVPGKRGRLRRQRASGM